MIPGIDHVVILVDDLTRASDTYRSLGFTVTPGGDHSDGITHNALIAFADESYLELLAFKQTAPDHWWWRHTAIGEGLIDWALRTDSIAADIATARENGLGFDGPVVGGRLRPDGQHIAWHTARPSSTDMPFLCADVTPRALRVPDGDACKHVNGVMSIASITIAVASLTTSLSRYQSLLHTNVPGQDNIAPEGALLEEGVERIALPVGTSTIILAKPAEGDRTARSQGDRFAMLHQHLSVRGEGAWALTLRTHYGNHSARLDPILTHGVCIELVAG